MSDQKNGAPRALTLNVLKRANSLAMMLLMVMAVIAAGLFILLDFIGWGGTGVRAMVSLLVAPLLLVVLAGGAWLYWRAGEHDLTSVPVGENEEEVING